MDQTTLIAYDQAAGAFAQDWHAQPAPDDLYALVRRFFRPGLTADIGCGSGRDVEWLCANGFAAVGYDAAPGMLAQARALYPQRRFEFAELPALEGIPDDIFDNVLCETVIMHLDREAIAPAARRLVAVLKPGGILYLSWRVTDGADQRDGHGRLYAAFDPALIARALDGTAILLDEAVVSVSSGKKIHRVVAQKAS